MRNRLFVLHSNANTIIIRKISEYSVHNLKHMYVLAKPLINTIGVTSFGVN